MNSIKDMSLVARREVAKTAVSDLAAVIVAATGTRLLMLAAPRQPGPGTILACTVLVSIVGALVAGRVIKHIPS